MALLTYTLVTAASISHVDIVVNRDTVLPLLDVQVPLHYFCFFASLLLLVLHVNISIHLLQLQDQAELYLKHCEPRKQETFYLYPVLWLMLTPAPPRRGKRRAVIGSIYFFVYIAFPLGTLSILQLAMLPSHRLFLATYLTGALVVDAVVISLGIPINFRSSTWSRRTPLFSLLVLLSLFNVYIIWPRDNCLHSSLIQRNLRVVSQDLVNTGGSLDLRDRDLRCGDFTGIDLTGAKLGSADLRHANFQNATLVDVSFVPINHESPPTKFKKSNFIGADLRRANLTTSDLQGAIFTAANLTKANLSRIDARGVDFTSVRAAGAIFVNSHLDGILANYADLSTADLSETTLAGASLRSVNLERAKLDRSTLVAASLVDARAKNANFSGAFLLGTDLRGANFEGAIGLVLQNAVATHVDLSQVTLGQNQDKVPMWIDLRAAKGADDIEMKPCSDHVLLNRGDWNEFCPHEPQEVYSVIAGELEIEMNRQKGLASEDYLEKALEEIARGERVPRIRALERSLRELGFGQEIACICKEPDDCGNSPIQGNQGDIFTGLTKKTVETQFEKLTETETETETETDNVDGPGWTCVVPTKARGEGGPKGCFCAENCGGGIGAGPNVVHLGLTQKKIDEYYRGDEPDNPTGWLCGNYRGTIE